MMGARTYERRRSTLITPTKFAGVDFSIPDDSDHAKHLRLVFAACRRGFTWLVRGNA